MLPVAFIIILNIYFLQDKKAELSQFLPDDQTLESYIKGMKTIGQYADHMAIEAMCLALPCRVRILQNDSPDTLIGTEGPQLVVGYLPQLQHYVSLESIVRYIQCLIM